MVDRFDDIARTEIFATAESGLQTTLSMFPVGMDLMRERLRADNPGWSEDEVQRQTSSWLRGRGLRGWRDGFSVKPG